MATFNEPTQWSHALGSKADVRQLPDDTSATTGLASLQKLFQMINQIPLDAGGVAPGRLDFNALFKTLGDSVFYAMNGGLASYNKAYDYPVNRFVAYNNNLYKCVKANGPSASIVVPGTNDSVWQAIPTKIEIPSLIPIATLLAKGIVQLCDNIDANASDNSKALTPYAVARQNYVKSVNKVRADAYGNVSITRVNSAASADSATRAARDITGQQINTTYVKDVTASNATITVTKGNGTTSTATINNVANATNATKAIQDKNGAQIDTTYFKSANGTFTGQEYFRDVNNSVLRFNGGNTHDGGASLMLFGKNAKNAPGIFDLVASTKEDGSYGKQLIGTPAGSLTWAGKNIVRSVNSVNADDNGNVQLGNFGVITGKIEWFAFNTAPDGYLVCNGANISRTTYANLFAVIGTTYGSGDGSTTFTLPNLIDKLPQGSTIVGTVKSAGLPNITASASEFFCDDNHINTSGAMYQASAKYGNLAGATDPAVQYTVGLGFDASRSSAVYGRSSTVQPPALTLLPCIKY